ncbi:LuxR C-terminal-related transcriptional regulator [Microbacterium sp. QXD-8]|uniref:LuxR C-terminal-related transcriptional regulator n=1 Tax=Microbacterium psychrotolerans TaxID=3068321 RepID=A0ABU0Z066_9MICO|nr:LuxR C-terminal-related transcriptional regulator [Microbacterium sp. QXD-8]MDQ7877413.1 LuxR C-terminal-related transcriptional regulator [Microbacterium sp. QXD-8]
MPESTEIARGITAALSGDGSVTLLSGEPGIGKTRLLQHALQLVDSHGWSTMVVAPDIDSALSPLGALIGAATRTSPPLLHREEVAPIMQGVAPKYLLTRVIAEGLELAAAQSGVLVVVDDLQWLDAGSLGSVTALIHDLQGVPVYWILATRSGVYSAAHQRFIAQIGELGTVLDLNPLDDTAAEAIARDTLGAMPGRSVTNAIGRAAGYPLLILEILQGLEEDGLLQSTNGVVDIDDDSLPVRFGTSAGDRLQQVSRDALRIAQVGSLYGRDFPLSGVLDVLGQTATQAAPGVQELLDLGFIVDTGRTLSFRHDSVQTAATESLSPTLRRAMAREVIHRRLRGGEGVATLASTIASVAEAGDAESLELLFLAANQLSRTDMAGAAGLVILGAQLSSGNPVHADRTAALLPLVLASGRVEDAMEISRSLRPLLGPDDRARINLAVSRQLTESDFDGAIRETAAGLAVPGISDEMRVQLLSVRALNFANKADERSVRETLGLAREVADEKRDTLALATLDATESVLTFYQGRFDAAEDLQRKAMERVAQTGTPTGLWLPEGLWMAFMRNTTGRCDEAVVLTDEGLTEARAAKNVIAEAFWMMVRSTALYHLGRLEDARTQAETVLDLGEQLGLGDFMNATAGVVLHRIGLRTGDVDIRQRARPLIEQLANGVGLTRTGRWSLAMEAMERGRPNEAYEYASTAIDTMREAAPSMTTPSDFADDFMLAYLCDVAGDRSSLEVVVEVTRARAELNPGNLFVSAIATAVRGVRDHSSADLLAAAEQVRSGCRPLVAALLFEAAGLFATDRDVGTRALTEAMRIYNACGAPRDVSRVLQRFRAKGINQRLVSAADATGLSHRERQVAEFVGAGFTTQQIANELLVSPHTVVTYIRHIYAKWGVSSRREVADHIRQHQTDIAGSPI